MFKRLVPLATAVAVVSTSPVGQSFSLAQGAAPTARVENLRVTQAASGVIQLTYDLRSDDPAAIFDVVLEVSNDGGATWTVRPSSATGSIGANVTPGLAKGIVWEAGKDVETVQFDQLRFRILPVARARPAPPAPPAPMAPPRSSTGSAPPPAAGSSGGRLKWLLIGGGGAGGALAAALAGKSSSSGPSSGGQSVGLSVTTSTPAAGGTIIVPAGLTSGGWGDTQPNLRLTMQFTAPAGSADDAWTINLFRGSQNCIATQGGYAIKQGAVPAASGGTTVTFVNYYWILQDCGTSFVTDRLVFTYNPAQIQQTVSIGWNFHP
jgi:hypothetical protein